MSDERPRVRVFAVPMKPRWRLVYDGESDVHVVPNQDLVGHTVDGEEDCVCVPARKVSQGHEGHDHPDLWIHQHSALGGRKLPNLT